MARKSLLSRPLDLVYFSFFLMHTLATIIMDLQAIYPAHLIPAFMKEITNYYLTTYNDPLIGGVMGYFGKTDRFIWFETFVWMEAFFQLPIFLLGMRGLWKGSRSIYVLLLIYAASSVTTTMPCLAVILSTPITSAETLAAKVVSVTAKQRANLLMSYVPFLIVPLLMAIDMGFRVLKLVRTGVAAEVAAKRK